MSNQHDKIDNQINKLADELQTIYDQNTSKLTSGDLKAREDVAKIMLKKADDLVDKISTNGNLDDFKEYLKTTLNLKNDDEIKKFALSSPENLKKYIQ